jgi:hypothetical protein
MNTKCSGSDCKNSKMRENCTQIAQYLIKYKQNGKGKVERVTREMK